MENKQTPSSEFPGMSNADLLDAFDIICTMICNAHNFGKGPTKATLADYENCKGEILRRMREGE